MENIWQMYEPRVENKLIEISMYWKNVSSKRETLTQQIPNRENVRDHCNIFPKAEFMFALHV